MPPILTKKPAINAWALLAGMEGGRWHPRFRFQSHFDSEDRSYVDRANSAEYSSQDVCLETHRRVPKTHVVPFSCVSVQLVGGAAPGARADRLQPAGVYLFLEQAIGLWPIHLTELHHLAAGDAAIALHIGQDGRFRINRSRLNSPPGFHAQFRLQAICCSLGP